MLPFVLKRRETRLCVSSVYLYMYTLDFKDLLLGRADRLEARKEEYFSLYTFAPFAF